MVGPQQPDVAPPFPVGEGDGYKGLSVYERIDRLFCWLPVFLSSLGQRCFWEAENQALAKALLDVGLQIKVHPIFNTIAKNEYITNHL